MNAVTPYNFAIVAAQPKVIVVPANLIPPHGSDYVEFYKPLLANPSMVLLATMATNGAVLVAPNACLEVMETLRYALGQALTATPEIPAAVNAPNAETGEIIDYTSITTGAFTGVRVAESEDDFDVYYGRGTCGPLTRVTGAAQFNAFVAAVGSPSVVRNPATKSYDLTASGVVAVANAVKKIKK